MKKLTLDLESLAVESFDTAAGADARGTVHGREATDEYDSCACSLDHDTCKWTCDPDRCFETIGCVTYQYSCQTSCDGGPYCDCDPLPWTTGA